MTSWGSLFERASVAVDDPRRALAAALDDCDGAAGEDAGPDGDRPTYTRRDPSGPDPGRIVVDADVLAADLLVDGVERTVGDRLRSHSWLDLVASDALLGRAEAVIAAVVDADLATAWHDRIDDERIAVDHPPGDHPGLASAYRGNAAHLVTGEESLRSVETGATVRRYVDLSIRSPDAFRRSFDPSRLYPMVVGGTYPGPDRDPRA